MAEFDLNVNYDNTVLNFDSYILGNELGDISTGDADDWSLGDLGGGIVNFAEVSWLFDFSFQPDSFTLATLSFTGNGSGTSHLGFSDVLLGDELGNSLIATLDIGSIDVKNPIPEPCSILLVASGIVGFVGFRRKFEKIERLKNF